MVEAIENIGREETTFDAANSVYLDQIAAAQEFLNENHNAGLARVQRLLQKMLPERFYGGQHLYVPNAREVEQNLKKK